MTREAFAQYREQHPWPDHPLAVHPNEYAQWKRDQEWLRAATAKREQARAERNAKRNHQLARKRQRQARKDARR